jgi:UDP-glucose 4-epimerase
MPNNTIFITGGAGFIGSWVAQCGLERDFDVVVYDNLAVGRMANIEPFVDRVRFYQADILDDAALSAALAETKPSIVLHLAAHHFIPFCNAHPLETMRVNVDGTYAVLRAAASCGAKTTVVASSGVVYASGTEALNEDDPPKLADIYGLSKHLDEEIARFFAETTSMRCLVARFFNTYGPRETNPHLIPHIMEALHAGPRVPLGNTHTKRDYIYVEDIATLLLDYACGAGPSFAVVNVGTGREYSAAEIVDEISALLGRPIQIEVDASRQRADDKMHQIADTGRLKAWTGRLPRYSLREGLQALLCHEGLL